MIPVAPRNVILSDAAVVLNGARIVEILPIQSARAKYRAERTIQLPRHVLIPGLINLHTHAAMTLMRGLADDLALMPWLQEHIWPAEKHCVSEAFARDGTLLACAEMLKGGTTCFNDMYFFPQAAAAAVDRAGMRACLGLVLLDSPTPYAADADDYLGKGLEARDQLRHHPRLTTSLAPHAPYTVSDRSLLKILTFAEQLDLNIHIHLHETADEVVRSEAECGMRPLQRLISLGLLGPNMLASHCVHVNAAEIAQLSAHACHVAHCPTSNLKLGSGIAPVPQMLAQGVHVGLGTDGAASNNRLDMFAEMRLAALLAKGSGDAACLPAQQALEMATLNGARALGLADQIGSIEAGKKADLTAVDISAIEMQPCFDPLSHLVYVAGREHVTHTWVEGELLYQDGVHLTIQQDELQEIVAKWQGTLHQFHR